MKNKAILTAAGAVLCAGSLNAAISLDAGTDGLTQMYIGDVGIETFLFNTVPAGAFANVYWDADNNGVFGETAKGENTGNLTTTLGFTTGDITQTTSFFFAMEGFAYSGQVMGAVFGIKNSDNSIQGITVGSGATTSFTDSNGDEWEAGFVFNANAYGDVVQNIDTGAGGSPQDHQGILTFTPVPEPSSALFLGAASLMILGRRRR